MMTPTLLRSARWYQALNLQERLSMQRFGALNGTDTDDFRWQKWRSEPVFATPADFEERLREVATTPDVLRELLGEKCESLQQRATAASAEASASMTWFDFVVAAYDEFDASESWRTPASLGDIALASALVMAAPLLQHARRQLRSDLRSIAPCGDASAFDLETVENLLFASLPKRLLSIMSRACVLEMHIKKMEGRLSGETADQRFASYIDYLRDPLHALALLHDYPVLTRELVTCLVNWRSASAAFVADLAADWTVIAAQFPQAASAGTLTAIDGGAGDHHRGGRSVMLLTFTSGWKLVYKPRSLQVDVHFQALLEWVNAHCEELQFRLLHVLPRGDHGWVEFIERNTAITHSQARRYYRRQGGYLALLYVLEATDFHYENLISAGEHPVLIDLEALFQPRLQDEGKQAADDVAGRELNYSVLRVGLLPQHLFTDKGREGLDVSGLGAQANQLTPFAIPQWAKQGTDDMHLVRNKGMFTGSPNRLQIDGVDVDVSTYADDIVAGFIRVYEILVASRAAFAGPCGPLQRFANDEVRVLLRATRTYARVLQESFHPDVLRDALDRDRLFESLWSRAAHVPQFPRVLAAERRELWNGDIPFFASRPGTCDLYTGDGEVISGFFAQSSLQLTQQQLARLCAEDCDRQTWYIRASLATISSQDVTEESVRPATRRAGLAAANRYAAHENSPLNLASAIGDRLAELAIRGRHDASWIGLTLINNRTFDLSPLALDLYDGLPGVALFLGYLGALSGERRHTELAQGALNAIRNQLPAVRKVEKSIGFFNGYGGLLHVYTHLGILWGDASLLAEAQELVTLIASLIDEDRYLDVIGGSAGAIPALLNYYHAIGDSAALRAAERCAERLLVTAQPQSTGAGWQSNVPAHRPLSGFSHGAAGIALALFTTAAATQRRDLHALARSALDYERSLFAPAYGNWLDMRTSSRPAAISTIPKQQHAWCHGAPGIGLARLLTLPHCTDAALQSEIEIAVETTLAQGFSGGHCLCHGMLGNIELLLQATRSPVFAERADWQVRAREISAHIARDIAIKGPACANPAAIESPGLMTGLAGIGYGLLRLADPNAVPSVLALAPPATAAVQSLRCVA